MVGFLLIVACVAVLFWNEGRAVTTEKSLAEGAGAVVSVANGPVDPANEGKLVHVTGTVATAQTLSDPEFSVSAQGIRLVRKVEMFQWVEDESTKTETQLGGGEQKVTTYTYKKAWHEGAVDSSDFHEPTGHQNPPQPLSSRSFQVSDATLGDFYLPQSVLDQTGVSQPLPLTEAEAQAAAQATGLTKPLSVVDGIVLVGNNPSAPVVGDLRISYTVVPAGDLSVIAQQQGNSFAAYQTVAGDRLELVENGTVAANAMFKNAADGNAMVTWIVRGVGLLLLFVGFSLILGPLGVVGDVIPFVGALVRMGTGLIGLVLALGVGTLTIAIAWFWYRPLLGVLILVVGFAITAGIVWLGRKRAKPAAAPAAA